MQMRLSLSGNSHRDLLFNSWKLMSVELHLDRIAIRQRLKSMLEGDQGLTRVLQYGKASDASWTTSDCARSAAKPRSPMTYSSCEAPAPADTWFLSLEIHCIARRLNPTSRPALRYSKSSFVLKAIHEAHRNWGKGAGTADILTKSSADRMMRDNGCL